jgi:hypothetical protein
MTEEDVHRNKQEVSTAFKPTRGDSEILFMLMSRERAGNVEAEGLQWVPA